MKTALRSVVFSALVLSLPVLACSFDTDCNPGSKCVKRDGQIYGVCYGGLFPGNSNDQQPVRAPLDVNGTYGNTCSFDTDCGPGSVCAKPTGQIEGVCMKRSR
jgi:hypothetical protein